MKKILACFIALCLLTAIPSCNAEGTDVGASLLNIFNFDVDFLSSPDPDASNTAFLALSMMEIIFDKNFDETSTHDQTITIFSEACAYDSVYYAQQSKLMCGLFFGKEQTLFITYYPGAASLSYEFVDFAYSEASSVMEQSINRNPSLFDSYKKISGSSVMNLFSGVIHDIPTSN